MSGWGDLDFEKGTVTFLRQLIETNYQGAPVYGPIKNDMPRTVDLAAETIARRLAVAAMPWPSGRTWSTIRASPRGMRMSAASC
jgi:hypothetical protein